MPTKHLHEELEAVFLYYVATELKKVVDQGTFKIYCWQHGTGRLWQIRAFATGHWLLKHLRKI